MTETEATAPKPRRGIYLLPNLFTTGGMLAGFYAIVAAIDGRFVEAAIAVFVAGLLDGIDGRVARLTNTQSAFGVQYDSLADLVSFGLAPALVLYTWSLSLMKGYGAFWGKVGWAVAFLYAACAALRLARFNTQVGVIDKRYFQGLASPAAAGFTMSYVWTMADFGIDGYRVAFVSLAVALTAALLMVSRFRYWSFKAAPGNERVPFWWIVFALAVFVLIVIDPPRVLLGVAIVYVLSGPIMTVLGLRRRRDRRDAPPAAG
jgi:CDP-diacylglycerol--serine O-phosphatidyltransferase